MGFSAKVPGTATLEGTGAGRLATHEQAGREQARGQKIGLDDGPKVATLRHEISPQLSESSNSPAQGQGPLGRRWPYFLQTWSFRASSLE